MQSIINISDLSHIIQLAVAPVFLLAGIAGFLNVMSGRLGRIVDRSREVERRALTLRDQALIDRSSKELASLRRRMLLNNWSIGFCTLSALLVCMLVVMMFVGSYWGIKVAAVIAAFFVFAMLSLIAALILFIRETFLATRTLRESREFLEHQESAEPKG